MIGELHNTHHFCQVENIVSKGEAKQLIKKLRFILINNNFKIISI